MAKKDNSKNSAELYREERKKRLAQAAKKNARRNAKYPNLNRNIKSLVAIVLALAVVSGVVFWTLDSTGVIRQNTTALKIGNVKVSVAEYDYYYRMRYENLCSTVESSTEQYGYNVYGLDTTISPRDQECPYKDEDGNPMTWSQYIDQQTVNWLKEFVSLYSEAKLNGYKIDDEDKVGMNETLEAMREQATASQLSLTAFLRQYYGRGMSERVMKKILKMQTLAQKFSEAKQEECKASYTDDFLQIEYESSTDDYDAVDLRYYHFKAETLTAEEGETEEALAVRQEALLTKAKAAAAAMLAKVTDEESFISEVAAAHEAEVLAAGTQTDEDASFDADDSTVFFRKLKAAVNSTISESCADWVFEDSRKIGDKSVFDTEKGSYVVYVVRLPRALTTVDARHILFKTVDDSNQPLPDEAAAQAKADAESLLAKWKAGDMTEDSFAALATGSDDTGSAEDGGLYEDIAPEDMVTEFDNWIFDEERKPGDTDIVETSYGYHVMYFVSKNSDSLVWRNKLREEHGQEAYSSYLKGLIDDEKNAYVAIDERVAQASEESLERIEMIIDASRQQQSSGLGYQ